MNILIETVGVDEDKALALQDRFVRGFAWLRKVAGMTQRQVADAAGWQQPYVDRLEDARSPLLGALSRIERYAQACGCTTVLAFADARTGEVVRTLHLGEDGAATARRILQGEGLASAQGASLPVAEAAGAHAPWQVPPLERR